MNECVRDSAKAQIKFRFGVSRSWCVLSVGVHGGKDSNNQLVDLCSTCDSGE